VAVPTQALEPLQDASAVDLPQVLVLTGVMIVVGVSAAAFFRGLKAPRTRVISVFGMLLTFASAGVAVYTALSADGDAFPRGAVALAAFTGGMAHAAYFGYSALPSAWSIPRTAIAGLGIAAGTAVAIAVMRPSWGWLLPIAVSLAVTVAATWSWAFSQRPPTTLKVGGRPVTCVRFPCPRCGVVADWAEGVSPCPECGLFVHIAWDPGEDEPARFAPERPDPARSARFACPGCGNVVDWVQGVTACGLCGKRLRMHWNVHVGAQV
jgi:hypothetical protein